MGASMSGLCDALLAETAALDELVAPLDDAGWLTPTPAPGWSIRDHVAHLAHFDENARIAITDPERFAQMRDAAARDPESLVERATAVDRAKSGPEALVALRTQRSTR